ncbi:hypothetical protein GCM10025783_28550 [Amnibacterium soli]|uniref:Uncharacterized protein n=1 Tax=Amnibacterium soli TaxID=1282736 RepID=A0ABP8ZDN6_9MICO
MLRVDPFAVELTVVRRGSYDAGERRSLSRDVERGLRTRLRQGVTVRTEDWDAGDGWQRERQRHVLLARALDAVSDEPPVFSSWSAAVLHDLPVVDARLDRVHVLGGVRDERRGLDGVLTHAFTIVPRELVSVGGLLVTDVGRTVIDLAGGSAFEAGVAVADAVLLRGLPRSLLEQAVDLAGPRRASRRIQDVVAFAHPGGESVAESCGRVGMFRLGLAPQELQHEVRDRQGLAGVLDTFDRRRRIGTEIDGLEKYLNPALAPQGAGAAVVREKWREDRLRRSIAGLARFGYREARNPALLRPVLAAVGLRPEQHRPALSDWAAEAALAHPRVRR